MIAIPEKYRDRVAVSPAEFSEILGIDESTYYRHWYPYVRSGAIASFKVGAAVRIILVSALAFVERQAAAHAA
jgi:hypothetical protein